MSVPTDQMMDTAQTARQPQASDPQEALFGKMVAALRNHVFGKGEDGITSALEQAEPDSFGRIIGEMVFVMVQEMAKQAEDKGQPAEYDMLLGVATEVIDDIAELAEANGIEIPDDQREFALLYAQQMYVENQGPTDGQRREAQQDLAVMKRDGMLDEATKYVQMRGAEAGADPFDVAGMDGGNAAAAPRGGLMGG